MTETIERPELLRINAWTGSSAPIQELPPRTPWAQRHLLAGRTRWLAPATPIDERRWDHPDVGWGLILPEKEGMKPTDLATAADAPEAIQRVVAARPGSPILRYRRDLQQGYLRRYYADGRVQDLSVQAPRPGIGDGRMPQYLLIYGSPAEIPWTVQYALNMSSYVGRLDLAGAALDNYVAALLTDWRGQTCQPRSPVVWSVDHGKPDITALMRQAIADHLWTKMKADPDLKGRRRLEDDGATRTALGTTLAEVSPALVITTSHGVTGPLSDPDLLKIRLGAPVDAAHQPLTLDDLRDWSPAGAIWYAHACCSAGSDATSRYADLLTADGSVGQTLNGVAMTCDAMVAPLARALLGAEQPLRAFVGHVEPTFDWTLRDPRTQQPLTHVLTTSLYDKLYQQGEIRTPIAHALAAIFKEAGAFYGSWQDAIRRINGNEPGMRDWALYRQLVAMDRQSLVILGDPTVALPQFS